MIDEWNHDRTGFARFSDDRKMRYRLSRALTPLGLDALIFGSGARKPDAEIVGLARRIVFVMLNPSTADAFKLDPTVSKCVKYAQRWGGDVLEVANIFALRSPYPEDLKRPGLSRADIGDDETNDAAIAAACHGASRIVCAWGRHGAHVDRGNRVARMLRQLGHVLHALDINPDGTPIHPLARGKAYVPIDRDPVLWAGGVS